MILSLLVLLGCPVSNPDDSGEVVAPVVCPGDDGGDVNALVAPFVQSVTPDSAWVVWETDTGVGSRVAWGLGDALGEATCGSRVPTVPGADPDDAATQVHEVQLTGLTPATTYYYQALTGSTESAVQHFRTPGLASAELPIRFIAMSDSQRDDNNPDQYDEVVQEGVVKYVRERFGDDLSAELSAVLFPGDLVDNGWNSDEWREDFFAPSSELFGSVPIYPTIGNHEGGSPIYFRYFHLPGDDEVLGEHSYWFDRSNVRVVALDSNGFSDQGQLDWLSGVLDDTCTNPEVDFVFAQLHHPWLSELWTPGESTFTRDVVAQLQTWSTACGKPSIHFFGHTHGYSRGQTRDHSHVMVNVASAGGALDPWDSADNQDYPEFTVTQSTWGFVLVEVEAGDNPMFRLTRVSRGNAADPADNRVDDTMTVWRFNDPPAVPEPASSCMINLERTMVASSFSDPNGHAHQASQWQIADSCDDWSSPVADAWIQRQNIYDRTDHQAADNLENHVIVDPPIGGSTWCWRVRYRDEGLVWSDWSAPALGADDPCQ